jgi:hypothetical protein
MIHNCPTTCKGEGKATGCRRGNVENRHPILATTFDDKGFPVYKRPLPRDLNVVPQNKEILKDWEGQCGVLWKDLCRFIFVQVSLQGKS